MVWIFWGLLVLFVMTNEFSLRVTQITLRIGVSWTYSLSFFDLYQTKWTMAILSKGCKPDNFESHNSLKFSFTNIQHICLNFVDCEFCWLWLFLWIKLSRHSCSMWGKLGWLSWPCEGLSSFNRKGFCYSYAWSCSLCEGRTSFCTGFISRKLCRFLLFLIGFTSLSVLLFFLYQSPSLSLCTVFDYISSNIDEVLSINPSANIFIFGDFNIHHKDWLTYFGGTDRSVGFNAGKTQLVSFDRFNNTGSIDVKMGGSVPEEKSSF